MKRFAFILACSTVLACSSDTFTGGDAAADAAADATNDASLDAPSDAKIDVVLDAGMQSCIPNDAGTQVFCPGNQPCCLLLSSNNYGKCEPAGQCN